MNKVEVIKKRGDSGIMWYRVYCNGTFIDMYLWKYQAKRRAKQIVREGWPTRGNVVVAYEF